MEIADTFLSRLSLGKLEARFSRAELETRFSHAAVEKKLRQALILYSASRSAVFALESWLGPAIELITRLERPRLPTDDRAAFETIWLSLEKLLRRDVDNIVAGVYPVEVLVPEGPMAHLRRLPKLLREGFKISRRRQRNETKKFSKDSADLGRELPEYYRRNFHFQGDGYLSADSADLYEHQVDILFAGASDAMRRLIIEPMRQKFGYGDGEGLRFLEIGAGTGRATRFVRLAYPKAKIVALDLSGPYLKRAQDKLKKYSRIDFVEGAGEALPFLDCQFDAVYSVFIFHELPAQIRVDVLSESWRVLKPGGFLGIVDSLQLGDEPVLNEALKQFPVQFHEPFYRHYIENELPPLLEDAGFNEIKTDIGFLSKVVSGAKAPKAASTKL